MGGASRRLHSTVKRRATPLPDSHGGIDDTRATDATTARRYETGFRASVDGQNRPLMDT